MSSSRRVSGPGPRTTCACPSSWSCRQNSQHRGQRMLPRKFAAEQKPAAGCPCGCQSAAAAPPARLWCCGRHCPRQRCGRLWRQWSTLSPPPALELLLAWASDQSLRSQTPTAGQCSTPTWTNHHPMTWAEATAAVVAAAAAVAAGGAVAGAAARVAPDELAPPQLHVGAHAPPPRQQRALPRDERPPAPCAAPQDEALPPCAYAPLPPAPAAAAAAPWQV
mmetsp:Transcript_8045/g.20514  ORF Transcript_8045/g.20514 Transcript_8045/m.20514 type:complete len:221 (+) Transcript_8045:227-889(+)